jgi:DNA-directed RNA polymerase subunit RPC12/RpoP
VNKGKRLYRCDECQKATFFAARELSRAARIKCPGCGSIHLTPSEGGTDDLLRAATHRSDTGDVKDLRNLKRS